MVMRGLLALSFLIMAAGAAAAGTVITAPFRPLSILSGLAYCSAANVGTNVAVVSTQLFDWNGSILDSSTDVTIPPGRRPREPPPTSPAATRASAGSSSRERSEGASCLRTAEPSP